MRNGKVLLLAALVMATPALLAQQPPAGTHPMPMPPGHAMQMPAPEGSQSGQMQPMDCQAMMQKMQASSKAMDERLAMLVDDMNKAKGSAKVDRMGAVINEMISQRKQMGDDMAAMMNHMMQHMQSGMMSGMAKSMTACPMMKGSAPAAKPSAAEPVH